MSERFKIIDRLAVGKKCWDEFVDSSAGAWLWHRYDMQDAMATWPGNSDLGFAVVDMSAEEKILAIVPLHGGEFRIKRIFPWRFISSHGGPALDNNLEKKQIKKIAEFIKNYLIKLAESRKVSDIHLELSPMAPAYRAESCPKVNPLLDIGCANTLSQTWIVDLRYPKDDLWNNMEGRARTAVRKAEKNGVNIRIAEGERDLDIYYDLHKKNYNRTGAKPHPKEYFRAIWQNFIPYKLCFILFAEHENRVVAAENFATYKKAGMYWTGAADQIGLDVQANSLLQWTAIQTMANNGIEWYETGEAFLGMKEGKPKGLSDFKRSFGCELYPYYRGRIRLQSVASRFVDSLRAFRG